MPHYNVTAEVAMALGQGQLLVSVSDQDGNGVMNLDQDAFSVSELIFVIDQLSLADLTITHFDNSFAPVYWLTVDTNVAGATSGFKESLFAISVQTGGRDQLIVQGSTVAKATN